MEQRKEYRRRVLKRAKLSFNGGFSSVECVVRNVTEDGAFIEFSDGVIVPEKFRLHNELDGFDVDCEIVRRRGNSAGVKFSGEKEIYDAKRFQILTPHDSLE